MRGGGLPGLLSVPVFYRLVQGLVLIHNGLGKGLALIDGEGLEPEIVVEHIVQGVVKQGVVGRLGHRAVELVVDAVILDEPTAFLDPLTEADILQEVLEATKGKLMIFVTHRLSFARQADQILYLKNGMIAEHGTHEELMEKGGDYCRMFTTQRRQYFAQEGENDAV